MGMMGIRIFTIQVVTSIFFARSRDKMSAVYCSSGVCVSIIVCVCVMCVCVCAGQSRTQWLIESGKSGCDYIFWIDTQSVTRRHLRLFRLFMWIISWACQTQISCQTEYHRTMSSTLHLCLTLVSFRDIHVS